ncbi:MAG TPA: DNA mismatch repair protein MutS, partial [Anaerolineae bacterium]|nr:DNA mismatch repair protein MutS [Anaerolineae bacterium]
MAKLKLDLHDIYNKGDKIEAELNRIVEEAIDRKIELVEI